jgi:hypothetical protein
LFATLSLVSLVAFAFAGACGGETSRVDERRYADDPPDATSSADAGVCASTTFHLSADLSAGASRYCMGGASCPNSAWLTILAPDGREIAPALSVCGIDCSSCSMPSCHSLICDNPVLPLEGIDLSWSGESWLEGTCGAAASSCHSRSCPPAGRYAAKMCGHALPVGEAVGPEGCGDRAAAEPTCVEVPFDYPTTEPVVGVLK